MVAEAEHRYEMARLAVEDNEHFECSTVELDRPGPSYTIDTISEILGLLGEGTGVYLLVGADEARDLMTWRDPVWDSGACDDSRGEPAGMHCSMRRSAGCRTDFASKLVRLEMPGVDISSTDLRERVRSGRSIRYLVPEAVEDYILD